MSWKTSKTVSIGALACSAAAGLVLQATPAAAATPTPIAAGQQYVALGSSFAASAGVPPVADVGCARSTSNYAHLVASALQLQLTDVTCASATTDHIINKPQTLLLGGVRPPQVTAVTAATDVVTVTVGGNDVNFIGDLWRNSCTPPNNAFVPSLVKPLCSPPDPAATSAALDTVTAKLVRTVEAIKLKAPEARVVLVDYPTVLPQNGKPCAALPLTRDQVKYSLDVARQLQLATKHAAQTAGAELVELSKASRDHDVCSEDPWVSGWVWGPDFLVGGVTPYHPNAEGMQAAARLVAAQLT